MSIYIVGVPEVYYQYYSVEADSAIEALEKVGDGNATKKGEPDYSYTLDLDAWDVGLEGHEAIGAEEAFSIESQGGEL